GSLDEKPALVGRHARHFARHRVTTGRGGVRRRPSRGRLRRRRRGTLRDREAREQNAGRRTGEHGWQLHDIVLLFVPPRGERATPERTESAKESTGLHARQGLFTWALLRRNAFLPCKSFIARRDA